MQEKLQYHLIVENNTTKEEHGVFFKAASFTIAFGKNKFDFAFKKGSKGKVVYEIRQDGKLLSEFDHPLYAPDCPPSEMNSVLNLAKDDLNIILSALIHLDITTDKDYKKYILDEQNSNKYTYQVFQKEIKSI